MKYCFIINPKAGKGGFVEELEKKIADECEFSELDYDVFVSESIEQTSDYVTEQSSKEDGDIAFIGCGGDGTLSKTVLSVMSLPSEARQRCVVGVMPVGTGNDFVSNFDNKEKFFDVQAQLEGTPYQIDLLKCNDMYSINMINIGFDCHVVCKKEEIGRRRWLPRRFAYIFSLIITLIRKPGVKMSFSADCAESVQSELLLTTLANGAFCGGGFNSNPTACLTDGMIDRIAVQNVGRIKFLSLVGSYRKGLHLSDKFKKIVTHSKCERVDMSFDTETPVSVDGEIMRTDELHVSVERGALRFWVPSGARVKIEAPCVEYIHQ